MEFKIETLEAEIAVLRARDEAREAVEEKAAAERRERMAAIVEKETVTSGKQQRAEAIRAMGRQNPGTMVPGDSEVGSIGSTVLVLCLHCGIHDNDAFCRVSIWQRMFNSSLMLHLPKRSFWTDLAVEVILKRFASAHILFEANTNSRYDCR